MKFVLIGRIPVISDCMEELDKLTQVLEPQDCDLLTVRDGLLYIFMDPQSTLYGYVPRALKALGEFCEKCATQEAIVETGPFGFLEFGPDPVCTQRVMEAYQRAAAPVQELLAA